MKPATVNGITDGVAKVAQNGDTNNVAMIVVGIIVLGLMAVMYQVLVKNKQDEEKTLISMIKNWYESIMKSSDETKYELRKINDDHAKTTEKIHDIHQIVESIEKKLDQHMSINKEDLRRLEQSVKDLSRG